MKTTETTHKPRRCHGEGGASLVEYALLLALIGFVCIGALSFFGSSNGGSVDTSAKSIVDASN
jgi:Flp pilus assembly pilin Flp